jgi:hypothetical protein
MYEMVYVSEAPAVWNLLKGVICLYKPAGITISSVRKILLGNICRGKVFSNLIILKLSRHYVIVQI